MNISISSNDPDDDTIIVPINLIVLAPDHDIRVVSLDAPSSGEAGKVITINTSVMNQGIYNETNIEIQLMVDGKQEDNFTISSSTPRFK